MSHFFLHIFGVLTSPTMVYLFAGPGWSSGSGDPQLGGSRKPRSTAREIRERGHFSLSDQWILDDSLGQSQV